MNTIRQLFLFTFLILMSISTSHVLAQNVAYLSLGNVSVYDYEGDTAVDFLSASNALFMATTPDGLYLYVIENGNATVSVWEIATGTKVKTIVMGTWPGTQVIGIDISPDGQFAYVSDRWTGNVAVIQTSSNTIIDNVNSGGTASGLDITPNGDYVYVANEFDNTVSVIATATNSVIKTISSTDFSSPQNVAITPDGAYAYVTNFSGGVTVIRTSDNTVITTVTAGTAPYGIDITPDGNFAYVSNFTSNDVTVIQTSTNTVVATIPTTSGGTWLRDVKISPDGQYAFVAVQTTFKTEIISVATNTVVKTIPGGFGIAFGVLEDDDCTPTDITCPSNIVRSNDPGQCGATVSFSLAAGATATPSSGSFFPVGTTTVNVTGSDGCDGTSTCSFTVTVNDTEKPSISCPSNTTVGTDDGLCGADVHLPAPNADDNCAVTQLKGRYRLVDENDNPLGSYTSRMDDPSDYLAVGRYQINWRAKDAANNKRSCSYYVTVVDDEDPTAVCKDVTVDFNGEASIDLSPSQVWNEAASDDNCGVVHYVGTSPSLSISCDDLGSVVPLTVTIRDEAGNTDHCTADVIVTGLPCGWTEGDDDGSLNCPGDTDVDYDTDDESFSMSSDGCWQGAHDPDKAAYVYQELCGDGTLTARLASINTAGYAGLMLRETLDPSSRRAGAVKDFSTRRVRREYRSSYGGSVTRIHSNRSRVEWFRIVRKGNEIKSYTSTNGSSWRLLYRVIMPNLEDCVHIGMMAYSKNSSSEVQAVFDNVSFSGSGSSLIDSNSLPNTFTAFDTDLEIEQPDVNIFPNPSNGQSQIELNGFQETPAQIMVRDAFGKVVRQIEIDYPEGAILPLELQDMPAGLYLISVMQDQQEVITKKLMIQK